MKTMIRKRPLTATETDTLTKELPLFPDIGLIDPNAWNKTFPVIYVATTDKTLIGICAAVPLKHWIKIGPLVVLKKYHGKGYGKRLFAHVVKQLPNQNLYIGSSNPIVWKMALAASFQKEKSFWKLSTEIKIYLIRYFCERLSLSFITDALNKRMTKRTYYYFLKNTTDKLFYAS